MAINLQRRSLRVCLTLFIILGICTSVASSGICGREFVFAPMPNYGVNPPIGVILQAVSDEDSHVNIFARGISLDVNLTLPSGSGLYDYQLPNSLIFRDVTGKINSTVVITSDNDIFVLAYNIGFWSSDVFSVNPKQNLGQEYFIATMTWENNPEGDGVISISASEHNTHVQIFLNSTVEFESEWFYPGDIIRYTLLPYETIQLLPQFTNITGSRVIGNASLAVSVGAKCANVPLNVGGCDHIAEQLAPFTAWGKEFVTCPFTRRTSGYVLQIIAGRDNTTVSYEGVATKLNMGHYVTVDIQNQTMMTVSADKPISIMQYSTGVLRDNGGYSGDPSMMRVIPVEQYVTMSHFPVYEFPPQITWVMNNYLRITSRCEYMSNITVWMNGSTILPLWTDHNTVEDANGTWYCSRWTSVNTGAYTLKSQPIITDDGREIYPRFSAVVYGTALAESYLYRAASDDKTLTCSTTKESSTESSIPCGISSQPAVSMTSSEPSTEVGPTSANTITSGPEPSSPKMSTASPPEETTDPPPPNTGLYVGIGIAAAIVVLVLLALTAYIIKLRHRLETANPSDTTSPKDAHVNHAYEEPAKHVEQPYEEPKPNLNHEYDDIDDKRTYVEIADYVNRPYAKTIIKDT